MQNDIVRYESNSVGKCGKPLKLRTDHQSEEPEPPQLLWGVIIVFSSSPAKYSTTLLVSQQGQTSNQIKTVSSFQDECLTAVTKGGYLPFICFPSLDPKWCKLESEQWSDKWPIFAGFPPFYSWTQNRRMWWNNWLKQKYASIVFFLRTIWLEYKHFSQGSPHQISRLSTRPSRHKKIAKKRARLWRHKEMKEASFWTGVFAAGR